MGVSASKATSVADGGPGVLGGGRLRLRIG